MVRGAGAIKRVVGMPGDFVVKDDGGERGAGKMMMQVCGLDYFPGGGIGNGFGADAAGSLLIWNFCVRCLTGIAGF